MGVGVGVSPGRTGDCGVQVTEFKHRFAIPSTMLEATTSTVAPVRTATTIYLVQHGLTRGDNTDHEIMNGWGSHGLTDEGKIKLIQTATYLADKGIGETYSSDLRRAVDSATVLHTALALEKPNTEREGLRGMDVGMLEGQQKDHVRHVLEYLIEKPWMSAPNGESYNSFLGRWQQELDRTIHEALGEEYACVYVTHSMNLAALRHLLSHGVMPLSLTSPSTSGGVVELDVHDSGGWVSMRPTFQPT